jgi:hypothetical protein
MGLLGWRIRRLWSSGQDQYWATAYVLALIFLSSDDTTLHLHLGGVLSKSGVWFEIKGRNANDN